MNKRQMSETFFLCALLAIIGGFLDAYTYIARGGVFAFAQTGNLIFLGMNLTEGNIGKVIYYLTPICSFIIGVMICELIKSKYKEQGGLHWRQIAVAIEIIILVIVGFIPTGALNMVANVLITFVCAMQVESFRKVNGNSIATTMCTGNLRSATEMLFYYLKTKDKKVLNKSLNYFGIIAFFVFGVALGTIFTKLIHQKSIFICSILLVIVFCTMFIEHVNDRT